MSYTKDEALWYAICQMRRAARMLDIEETQLDGKTYLVDIYGNGLDMCADECEQVIDPDGLERMWKETFPNEVGKVGTCNVHDESHEQRATCTNFKQAEA